MIWLFGKKKEKLKAQSPIIEITETALKYADQYRLEVILFFSGVTSVYSGEAALRLNTINSDDGVTFRNLPADEWFRLVAAIETYKANYRRETGTLTGPS